MHELSDSTWIYIFEELLKSRSLLVDCEHLGDFVEDFEEMLDELRLAISNASDEVKSLEALKHSARLVYRQRRRQRQKSRYRDLKEPSDS